MFLSNFDPKVSFSSPIRNLNEWVSDGTSRCRSWPKWLRMLPFIQQSFSLFEKFLRPKYRCKKTAIPSCISSYAIKSSRLH